MKGSISLLIQKSTICLNSCLNQNFIPPLNLRRSCVYVEVDFLLFIFWYFLFYISNNNKFISQKYCQLSI